MSEPLYLEDLNVGDSWTSRARTITETDVVNFAGMTGDYDPLHVDHEFARQTPFGKPIAHGLLGLSFVAGLSSHAPSVQTRAFTAIRDWEFHLPAFIGDTVHVITEVQAIQPSGRRSGKVIWKRRLMNQKGEVIQSGILETLVKVREPKRSPKAERRDQPAAPQPHITPKDHAKEATG